MPASGARWPWRGPPARSVCATSRASTSRPACGCVCRARREGRPALACGDVGEVRQPDLVRGGGREIAREPVGRDRIRMAAVGRPRAPWHGRQVPDAGASYQLLDPGAATCRPRPRRTAWIRGGCGARLRGAGETAGAVAPVGSTVPGWRGAKWRLWPTTRRSFRFILSPICGTLYYGAVSGDRSSH